VFNKGLVRVQRPVRSHEGFHIKVCQVDGRREQLVSEKSFDAVEDGRRHARVLVSQIEDGTFNP
jgi:acetolactate synthase regulatory subunit